MGSNLLKYLRHADAVVAFIIHAFAIFDEYYLWRFMINGKLFRYDVRNIAVCYQVEEVEIYLLRGC